MGYIHAVVKSSEFALNLLTCLFMRRPNITIRLIGLIVYTNIIPNRPDVSTETCTSLLCFDAISLSVCRDHASACNAWA